MLMNASFTTLPSYACATIAAFPELSTFAQTIRNSHNFHGAHAPQDRCSWCFVPLVPVLGVTCSAGEVLRWRVHTLFRYVTVRSRHKASNMFSYRTHCVAVCLFTSVSHVCNEGAYVLQRCQQSHNAATVLYLCTCDCSRGPSGSCSSHRFYLLSQFLKKLFLASLCALHWCMHWHLRSDAFGLIDETQSLVGASRVLIHCMSTSAFRF